MASLLTAPCLGLDVRFEWECPARFGRDIASDLTYSWVQINTPAILALTALLAILVKTVLVVARSKRAKLVIPAEGTSDSLVKEDEKRTRPIRLQRPTLNIIQTQSDGNSDAHDVTTKKVDKNHTDTALESSSVSEMKDAPFAPPFVFQALSLLLNGSVLLESLVVIFQSISCQPATESLLFYLAGCFSIYIVLLFSLVNNPTKAPSTTAFAVWTAGLGIEATLWYLSRPSFFITQRRLSSDGAVVAAPLYILNIWNAARWIAIQTRFCVLTCQVATYLLCLSDVGTTTFSSVMKSLRLGTFLEIPLVEKVEEQDIKPNHLERSDSFSDEGDVRESQMPTRSNTAVAMQTLSSYQRVNEELRNPDQSEGDTASEHSGKNCESRASLLLQHQPQSNRTKDDHPAWGRAKKGKTRSWWDYVDGYRVYSKYLWPKPTHLRLSVVLCVLICFCERVINPLSAFYFKRITSTLEENQAMGQMLFIPFRLIMIYSSLKLVQGSKGWLQHARSLIWSPVQQYTYRLLSIEVFKHVHALPYSFHSQSKAPDLLSAINKGGSVTTFLENVSFSVLPAIVDIAITITYFIHQFGVSYARVIGFMSCWYIYATMSLAKWRTVARRELAESDRRLDGVKLDSLFAYKTVKYFNTEKREVQKLESAIEKFQRCQRNAHLSQIIMEGAQSLIFICGLLVVCLMGTSEVTKGTLRTSDLATLIDYMVQLRGPLNVFSDFYRMVQNAMINAERITELFKLKPRIPHNSDAIPMTSCEGRVQVEDVWYTFETATNPSLCGLNLDILPGSFTALVGASGGGKSTIFDLLFRFFDADSGKILIDGHPIEGFLSESLKQHMTIVPQHVTMAYDTILNNLLYVKPDATHEEVIAACEAANIHDEIMLQPNGYNTLVGSNGDTLSGGQRQRIGLARAILRNSQIILLDEPTSALDAITEQKIQRVIENLSRVHGRTVIVIAHRLSTISTADQIYVLEKGRVVEKGTETELLGMKGAYFTLWREQKRAIELQRMAQAFKNSRPRQTGRSRRHSASEVPHRVVDPPARWCMPLDEMQEQDGYDPPVEGGNWRSKRALSRARFHPDLRPGSSSGSENEDQLLSDGEGLGSAATSADESTKRR